MKWMYTLASITTCPHFLFQPFVLSQLQTKADAISPVADSRDKTHNHEHTCRNRSGCAHTKAEGSPRTHFILCNWTRSALKPEMPVLMFQLEPCEGHTFKLLWGCCCYPSWHRVLLVLSLCLLSRVVFSSNTVLETFTVLAPWVVTSRCSTRIWQTGSSAHFAPAVHQFCYWDISIPLSATASLTSNDMNWPGHIPTGSKYISDKGFQDEPAKFGTSNLSHIL